MAQPTLNQRDATEQHEPALVGTSDEKFAESLRWIGIVKLATQLAGWAVTIFVARILSPAAYGVVAAGAAYIALIRMLTELGLASALVARPSVTARERDQTATLAIGAGIATILATAIAAPWVASLLREPALTAVLPVLSIGSALSATNAVPIASLQRELRYRELALTDLARAITAALVLLATAVAGLGYWSLVLSEVLASVLFTIVLLQRSSFRLSRPRLSEIKEILTSSLDILGSRIAWYVSNNIDVMIVSRQLGASALGVYSMAWTLTSAPAEKLTGVLYAVTPGIFAKSQRNLPELRRYFLATLEALLALVLPLSLGLAIVAIDFVPLVLGERWRPAIPVVQYLGILIPLKTITPLCGQALVAIQRSRLVMFYAVGLAIALPGAFLLGARWGAPGVAMAWALVYPPFSALQFVITSHQLGIKLRDLGTRFLWPVMASLAMVLTTVCCQRLLGTSAPLGRLAATVFVGALSYGLVMAGFRRAQLQAALAFIRLRK